ncbi:MAG: methionine adenosyltransferase [Candidatus Aenigmarchaeota archaeon]|nr:methionine adenosyltransferase [Candidatus Aenigmarchaeota archaeon]
MRSGRFLFTSESVTEGHPDKICDQISDAILDDLLRQDPASRVACETLVKTGMVIVTGEITTKGYAHISKIVRSTIREIGYIRPEYGFDYQGCAVITAIDEQSPDIALGVDTGGAGDQGMMSGFATNETPEMMPLAILLAHNLTRKLAELRKSGKLKYLRPDGKSQVTVEYDNSTPKRVEAVVLAAQHDPDVTQERIRKDLTELAIRPVCGKWLDEKTKIYVNNTGRFVVGGPVADSGMTGRKVICDTYGGTGGHGGGAFCLAGDSLINTEKGLIRIDEFKKAGRESILIKTDVHPMPCGAWYDNGLKPTQIIITEDGYQLEATLNHHVRIIDKRGNYVWKPAGKLEKGDLVAIQTNGRLFGNDEIEEFKYKYRPGTAEGRKKKYTFPVKLTEDFAYLLGLLIGDGDCTDEGCIKICICESEMREIVQNIFRKIAGEIGKTYGHWAYLGGIELRAYLKHLGLTYAKSFEKTVPKAIFSASKQNCAAFLRGLFDTDGSVRIDGRNKNTVRIHLATTSQKLAQHVQLLLLNFGIISAIRTVPVSETKAFIRGRKINSKHFRYDVTIKGSRSVLLFRENIGFSLSRKQTVLGLRVPIKRDLRLIPHQRERVIRIFGKLSFEIQKKDVCKISRFTRISRRKATKELTYEKLKEFVEAYEPLLQNESEFAYLQQLFYMNHYYSPVKLKIPSFAPTYDLNIPFSHTFTANGFVCHNSGKDPTKVDRTASYMARHIAKNLVAAGLCEKCEIQLSYVIGGVDPISLMIDTFRTNKVPIGKIEEMVRKHFPLKPKEMIEYLSLRRPIFRKTAAYGHFGRDDPDFTWERTDKAAVLRKEAGL